MLSCLAVWLPEQHAYLSACQRIRLCCAALHVSLKCWLPASAPVWLGSVCVSVSAVCLLRRHEAHAACDLCNLHACPPSTTCAVISSVPAYSWAMPLSPTNASPQPAQRLALQLLVLLLAGLRTYAALSRECHESRAINLAYGSLCSPDQHEEHLGGERHRSGGNDFSVSGRIMLDLSAIIHAENVCASFRDASSRCKTKACLC